MMRRVTNWLNGLLVARARRRAQAIAAATLAKDFGLPVDEVAGILERASTDVRKLTTDGDGRPIVDRAATEMRKLAPRSFPAGDVQRYLPQLPDRDSKIFAQRRKKHCEIAQELGISVESVRESLIRTYVDLRLTTMPDEQAQRRKQA